MGNTCGTCRFWTRGRSGFLGTCTVTLPPMLRYIHRDEDVSRQDDTCVLHQEKNDASS